MLACAIVTELEPFDCTAGDPPPSAEVTRVDGVDYPAARCVALADKVIRIERERLILPLHRSRPQDPLVRRERDVVELDRLSACAAAREGRRAGLTALAGRSIAATEEHVGSEVVLLRA